MTKTIRVSRTWKIKDYESYRVSLEDDVPDGVEIVEVSRQLAIDAHAAYDDYLFLLGSFSQASEIAREGPDSVISETLKREARKADLPRRDGAEQGRATADSPTPTSAGAGAGSGAEDPGAPPAKGPGSVTEAQLDALATLTARSTQMAEFVRKALIRLRAERIEQISTEAAAALIGKLNRLGPESEA